MEKLRLSDGLWEEICSGTCTGYSFAMRSRLPKAEFTALSEVMEPLGGTWMGNDSVFGFKCPAFLALRKLQLFDSNDRNQVVMAEDEWIQPAHIATGLAESYRRLVEAAVFLNPSPPVFWMGADRQAVSHGSVSRYLEATDARYAVVIPQLPWESVLGQVAQVIQHGPRNAHVMFVVPPRIMWRRRDAAYYTFMMGLLRRGARAELWTPPEGNTTVPAALLIEVAAEI